jgi:hypothetical protein
VNKEIGRCPKNIMAKFNVPFRIRRDPSVFAEIDNYVANQEARKLGHLAAGHDINLPAKHANNTNPRKIGGAPISPDSRNGCLPAHD